MTDESWREHLKPLEERKFMPRWQFELEFFLERHWRGLLYLAFLVWCLYGAVTAKPEAPPEMYYEPACDEQCY